MFLRPAATSSARKRQRNRQHSGMQKCCGSQSRAPIQIIQLPGMPAVAVTKPQRHTGQREHVESKFSARPKFSLGFMPLGRGGQRLLPLWLETAFIDSLSRRFRHDDHVVHRAECAGDVAGLRRGDLRGLVAVEAGILAERPSNVSARTRFKFAETVLGVAKNPAGTKPAGCRAQWNYSP